MNKIEQVQPANDPYHKVISINDRKITAFIDLGSEVVTLRKTDAHEIGCEYEPSRMLLQVLVEEHMKPLESVTIYSA